MTRASEVELAEDKYNKHYPPLLLDLPCTLFSLSSAKAPLAAQVARLFQFSPQVQVSNCMYAGPGRVG